MEIVEEIPLTVADRAAGVTWQGMVNLRRQIGRVSRSAWSKSKWMGKNCYWPPI